MKTKSIKRKMKEMQGPILERMCIEQVLQAKLRTTMVTSEDQDEIDNAREDFDESVEHWEVLRKSLEEYDKLSKHNWKINPDTALVVAGNLAGILLILNFEKLDIVRSKAIGFVLKGRL